MTDTDALLAAILASPDEDTPRLLYADALDEGAAERGEPLPCARSEFIRVQCELSPREARPVAAGDYRDVTCQVHGTYYTGDTASAIRLKGRERTLLINFPAAPYWGLPRSLDRTHPHRDVAADGPAIRCHGFKVREVTCLFRRGFVEGIECAAADWLNHSEAILAAHPVRRVKLATWPSPHQTRAAGATPITLLATIAGRPVTITEAEVMAAGARIAPRQLHPRILPVLLWRKRWPGITFDPPA